MFVKSNKWVKRFIDLKEIPEGTLLRAHYPEKKGTCAGSVTFEVRVERSVRTFVRLNENEVISAGRLWQRYDDGIEILQNAGETNSVITS